MTPIEEFLDGLVAEGEVARGYQVAVRVGDDLVIDAAGGVDGRGEPLTTDGLIAMYCSTKALLAITVGVLATEGALDLDGPIGDHVEGCAPHVARLTVATVLSHRSGLAAPTAPDAVLRGPEAALRSAATSALLVPPLGSDETSYSVAAEPCLAAACIRSATQETTSTAIRRRVLDPAGCADDFSLGDDNRARRAVGVTLGGASPVPLLIERTRRLDLDATPGFGGFASARGLSAVFGALAAAVDGRGPLALDPAVAARLVTPGPLGWDRTFERTCSFGLGVLTRLETHTFGSGWSPSAFAQAGISGLTTVVADPELGLSASVQINGLTDLSISGEWLRGAAWSKLRASIT